MDNATKKEDIIKAYANDVVKVLDCYARNVLIKHYGSADKLKTAIKSFWGVGKQDNRQLATYIRHMPNIISSLVPAVRIDGRLHYITRDVINAIQSKYRVVNKLDISYKSGKEYHRQSYILIKPSHIDKIMHDDRLLISTGEKLETKYTKRQSRLIRKVIFVKSKTKAKRKDPTINKTINKTITTTTNNKETKRMNATYNDRVEAYLRQRARETLKCYLKMLKTTLDPIKMDNIAKNINRLIEQPNLVSEKTKERILRAIDVCTKRLADRIKASQKSDDEKELTKEEVYELLNEMAM